MRTLLIWVIAAALFLGVNYAGAQVYKKVTGPVTFTGTVTVSSGRFLAPSDGSLCSAPAYGFSAASGLGFDSLSGDNNLDFCKSSTLEWRMRADGLVPGNDNVNTVGTAALRISSMFTYQTDIKPKASPPGSPTSGMIYVDSTPTPDELCFYDGAAWQGISSGTDANCQ